MGNIVPKSLKREYQATHMTGDSSIINRHLLLQFGDRLRGLRKARGMTAEQLASAAGITRKTLGSVEAGDPTPAIGTYLRVMTALGINGELALLAGDTLTPPPAGSAAARTRRPPPVVKVEISASGAKHQTQDLLSIALHERAIRAIKARPELAAKALATVDGWIRDNPQSRAMSLWLSWRDIITQSAWRKAMGSTSRAQQLRQASPLAAVLPEKARRAILNEVAALKSGLVLEGAMEERLHLAPETSPDHGPHSEEPSK